jgi:hypothetical protein
MFILDPYQHIRFFFQFSFFPSKFRIYTPWPQNPSLDPELGVMAYSAEVTRLDTIGHGIEVGG